jgi:uncharacterized membrane protein
MITIWQVFVNSLKGGADSEISSRRLITMIILQVGVLINLAIIVMSFVVIFRPAPETNTSLIQVMDRLIELVIISWVAVFLLVGLITWQNVNDTLSLIRGGGITQNITKAADQIQEKAQDIKDAAAAQQKQQPAPKPGVA